MPTVEWNSRGWQKYSWVEQGEEWSETWGGSEAQWFGAIFPRIHGFLPTGSILEIAPGFGRWTNYLKNYCEHLTVVDLAENCIEACKKRFTAESHITYHTNDGTSLAMVPDRSIDFVFSFDSLVHVEADVLEKYLQQLSQKLTPNGVGFIHHSNIGEYNKFFEARKKIPRRWRKFLVKKKLLDNNHSRGFTVTAGVFEKLCDQAGLQCIGQEVVNWGTKRLIDCFSTFTLKTSAWARPNQVIRNPDFMREADLIRKCAPLYSVTTVPGKPKE